MLTLLVCEEDQLYPKANKRLKVSKERKKRIVSEERHYPAPNVQENSANFENILLERYVVRGYSSCHPLLHA